MKNHIFRIWMLVAGLIWLLAVCVQAQIGALGVMGDSLSDEYFEETSTYGRYATNWVPLLVDNRGINVGSIGDWGGSRRNGYKYNWALSGATSSNLLADGQHTGLAAQVVSEGLTHAVLAIGANDFHPQEEAYFSTYIGIWDDLQVSNYVSQVISNIEEALTTIDATGVKLVVLTLLDYGKTPAVYNHFFYGNASQRQRVADAIEDVNEGVRFLAQRYQVPLVDAYALQEAIFGSHNNFNEYLYVGNVQIKLGEGDTDPINNPDHAAAFVEDEAHPHTVIQGLFANVVLRAFERYYGTTVSLFTEAELLAHAGLAYGGSDTLAGQLGDYNDYLTFPVLPEWASAEVVGSDMQIGFTTVSGQFYRVEAKDDLMTGSWSLLSNNIAGTGGTIMVIETDALTHTKRFYTVRQLP